jgi:hypothetical protein
MAEPTTTTSAAIGLPAKLIHIPDRLLFGFGGAAWIPGIILIGESHAGNTALIAHEQCHHDQQRRDGYLRWCWRYVTSKKWRLRYEVEAYRVWLGIAHQDRYKVLHWLTHNYGAGLPMSEIAVLLDSKPPPDAN